jgi:hypothetical protein
MSTFSVSIGLAAMELTQQILKYWGESENLDDLAIAVPVDDLYRVHLFRARGGKEFSAEPLFQITPEHAAIDKQYEPALTFTAIKVAFENHLSRNNQTDYTIAQLEAFIEQFVAEPKTAQS